MEKHEEIIALKEALSREKLSKEKESDGLRRENELLLEELERNNENEKTRMFKQMEDLKASLNLKKENEMDNVKAKFSQLEKHSHEEINELTDRNKVLKLEKEALQCKIELLDASIHEES